MTMNKSSQWKTLRALAAVPVIALALLAFANPKSVAAVVTNQPTKVSTAPDALPDPVQVEAVPQLAEAEAEEPAVEEKIAEEQVPNEPVPESKKVYESVEQMPEFPGGVEGLMRYLQQNVQYPPTAIKNNVQGRVIVQFIIDETGQVGDVKVVRSVSEEVDAEAVRVIKSMPKFDITFKMQGDPKQPQEAQQEQPQP